MKVNMVVQRFVVVLPLVMVFLIGCGEDEAEIKRGSTIRAESGWQLIVNAYTRLGLGLGVTSHQKS
jgi:hypothetical protein